MEEEERGHCVHGVRREERTKKGKDARRDKKREREREAKEGQGRKKEDQDAGCRSSFNNNDYLRPRSIDVDV